MPGRIIPGTPIAVDFWRRRAMPSASLFFLSHCHADHMEGLNGSWDQPIYCSDVSAKLVVKFKGVAPHLLRVLSLNEEHDIALDELGHAKMTVRLFDADHCPGAVMFLFSGYFGRILYTGDFRYEGPAISGQTACPNFLDFDHDDGLCDLCKENTGRSDCDDEATKAWNFFWRCVNAEPIDRMYLDTTYLGFEVDFASRKDGITEVLRIIEKHPHASFFIAVRNLGKEQLLVAIAEEFRERILVPESYLKTLQLLDLPQIFTSSEWHRIQTVPFNDAYNVYCKVADIVGPGNLKLIYPTALECTGKITFKLPNDEEQKSNFYFVPYSDHCSRSEIIRFLKNFHCGIRQIETLEGRISGDCLALLQCHVSISLPPRSPAVTPLAVKRNPLANQRRRILGRSSTGERAALSSRPLSLRKRAPQGVCFDTSQLAATLEQRAAAIDEPDSSVANVQPNVEAAVVSAPKVVLADSCTERVQRQDESSTRRTRDGIIDDSLSPRTSRLRVLTEVGAQLLCDAFLPRGRKDIYAFAEECIKDTGEIANNEVNVVASCSKGPLAALLNEDCSEDTFAQCDSPHPSSLFGAASAPPRLAPFETANPLDNPPEQETAESAEEDNFGFVPSPLALLPCASTTSKIKTWLDERFDPPHPDDEIDSFADTVILESDDEVEVVGKKTTEQAKSFLDDRYNSSGILKFGSFMRTPLADLVEEMNPLERNSADESSAAKSVPNNDDAISSDASLAEENAADQTAHVSNKSTSSLSTSYGPTPAKKPKPSAKAISTTQSVSADSRQSKEKLARKIPLARAVSASQSSAAATQISAVFARSGESVTFTIPSLPRREPSAQNDANDRVRDFGRLVNAAARADCRIVKEKKIIRESLRCLFVKLADTFLEANTTSNS